MNKNPLIKRTHTDSLDTKIARIILVISFLWFIPFINKGIDYTDAAYNLNVFNSFYESGGTSIGMFMTNLIGGTICLITPAYQYLVFRILYWITYIIISLLLYASFKKVIPKTLLAGSIFIGFFMIKHGTTFMAYNSMSAIGLALLIFLLNKAFEKDRSILFFLSGFVVGVNIFVRLPNLLQFGFIVAIIWYYGFVLKKIKYAVTKSILFIFGCITSSAVCLVVYLIKNNFSRLVNSASSYGKMAADSSSSHGITNMICKFITQCISVVYVFTKYLLPFILAVLFVVYVILFIASRISKRKLSQFIPGKNFLIITTVVTALASIVYAVIYLNNKSSYQPYMHLIGLINLFLGIFCAVIFRKRCPRASISAVLCACVSVVMTFGSDNIMNSYFSLFAPMVIGFVLCIYHIYKLGIFSSNEKRLKRFINRSAKLISLIMSVIIIFSSLTIFVMQLFPFTYGPYLNGNGNITELNTSVNTEIAALRGMKTTPQRAEQINEFYNVINTPELADKELAVFGYFPLAFALCDNDNYFHSSWIDLGATSIGSLERTYSYNKSENNLPVIVVSYIYANDINNATPVSGNTDGIAATTNDKQEFLDKMLEENKYELFYESDNFSIYKP